MKRKFSICLGRSNYFVPNIFLIKAYCAYLCEFIFFFKTCLEKTSLVIKALLFGDADEDDCAKDVGDARSVPNVCQI